MKYNYYRVTYQGNVFVARRKMFSRVYELDSKINCKRSELKIEARIYPPFVSKNIRHSSFNNWGYLNLLKADESQLCSKIGYSAYEQNAF